MTKVTPWHSNDPNNTKEKKVYHDNNKCTTGNNIEAKYRKSGKGIGRVQCKDCADWEQAENNVKAMDNQGFFDSVKRRD